MATFRTTCPRCGTRVDLTSGGILLYVDAASADDDAAGRFGYLCPTCSAFADRPVSWSELTLFVAAGVTILVGPVEDDAPTGQSHPEQPTAGAALTVDDLLDLHVLLGTADWFDQLRASVTSPH